MQRQTKQHVSHDPPNDIADGPDDFTHLMKLVDVIGLHTCAAWFGNTPRLSYLAAEYGAT